MFTAQGHDVTTCDLLPAEGSSRHYQGNVLDIIDDGWDMMIAHPPCTYLSLSGVRWLYERPRRWEQMILGAVFFRTLWEAKVPRIAIENPLPHRYAIEIIGTKYDQIIQPWQFGHGETKATCFWLKNLPKLRPTNIVAGREHRVHREPPSSSRWKNRSRIFVGISEAMANQWGKE